MISQKSAKISIKKQMSLNKDKYVPEAGARFQIIDPHGDVVDTLTTDEKGEVTSIPLAIGVYTLHQTYGDPKHDMMEDEDVVLIKSDVHKTVTFGPYNDDEKDDRDRTDQTFQRNKETAQWCRL